VVRKFDPEEAFRLLDEEMYNATYAIQELWRLHLKGIVFFFSIPPASIFYRGRHY